MSGGDVVMGPKPSLGRNGEVQPARRPKMVCHLPEKAYIIFQVLEHIE
jgi:hypothetical protein